MIQPQMNNLEQSATLGTQDTRRRQNQKQASKQTNKQRKT